MTKNQGRTMKALYMNSGTIQPITGGTSNHGGMLMGFCVLSKFRGRKGMVFKIA